MDRSPFAINSSTSLSRANGSPCLAARMSFYFLTYIFSCLCHLAMPLFFLPSPPVKRLYALFMTIMDGGIVKRLSYFLNVSFALLSALPAAFHFTATFPLPGCCFCLFSCAERKLVIMF